MTDRMPRTIWTDDQLDEALSALHANPDTGHLAGPRTALTRALQEPPRPPRRRRWPYAVVAAGAAALALGGVAVVGTLGGSGTTGSAADTLTLAARHTVAIDDVTAKPGQYTYVDNEVVSVSGSSGPGWRVAWRQKYRTQTWVPADESSEWTQTNSTVGGRQWLVGSAAQAAEHDVDPAKTGAPSGTFTARCGDFTAARTNATPDCERPATDYQQATSAMLTDLPRDPHKLLATLQDGQSRTPDVQQTVLQDCWLMLQSGLVPADLRAAMYKALALMPDLKVAEKSANLDGEHGTALGVTANGIRMDVIVNADSGQLVGFREVRATADKGLAAGTVLDESAFHVTVVDKPGATT